MLKRTAIFSAILLGLAVPSSAQKGQRGEHRAPTRAQRDLREPVRHSPRTNITTPRTTRRTADSRRARGHGHDRGHGRGGRSRVFASHNVHYHYVTEKVWVPGAVRRVLIPAQYESRWDPYCRSFRRVCVRAAYYTTVQDPGYWDYRRVRVPHRTGRRSGGLRTGIHFRF